MVGLCNLPHDGNYFVLLERFDVFGIMVKICDSIPREYLTMAFSKSLCLCFHLKSQFMICSVQYNKVSSVLQPLAIHITALQPMMFLPVAPHSQWDSWAHQLSLMWKLLFILLFIYYLTRICQESPTDLLFGRCIIISSHIGCLLTFVGKFIGL